MSDILHLESRSLPAQMLFSALPTEQRVALEQAIQPRSYSDGEIIQQRGDSASGFFLIERGSVAVGQFLANGDFRGMALLGPGDSWGELAMFSKRPRVVDAVSRGRSAVRYIPEAVFDRVLAADPQVMRGLLAALSVQLQELLDVVAGIRRGTAGARIAGMLANLSGTSQLPVRISLTQQELGEFLGLTRATVNAALKELEGTGAIRRRYGGIEVLDREPLLLSGLD